MKLPRAAAGLARLQRVAVVLAALLILYLRSPITFTHPQFWGEDAIFFVNSRVEGWASLTALLAGYLCSAQALVALLASFFKPEFAAPIYCYAAIGITLGVVWLITSPRLDLPAKPLLAIAVVTAPMGWEVLGNLANCQWILPVGVFALLFTRPAVSRNVLAAETLLVGVTAFTGPFSVFLAPLFFIRAFQARASAARGRMALFGAISLAGAVTQILMLAAHPQYAAQAVASANPWTLWVTLPAANTVRAFGPIAGFLPRMPGVAPVDALAVMIMAVLAGALAWRPPYRTEKVFMLFFALAIAASGMWKCRAALAALAGGGARYFYIDDVFALWFVCCLATGVYSRALVLAFVAATEILLVPVVAGTPRVAEDMAWPVWARLVSSGLPVLIPTSPPGWSVALPAAPDGPLAAYDGWLGRPLAAVTHFAAPSACGGMVWQVAPFTGATALWTVSGTAWAAGGSAVKLVALDDGAGIVKGFGLPGFSAAGAPKHSGWNAVVRAPSGTLVHAYAVLSDHLACPLAGGRYAEADQPVGGGGFYAAVPLLPGQDIVQIFKPLHRFDRLDVRFVAYGRVSSDYPVGWEIDSLSQGKVQKIGAGTIDARGIRDWQFVTLPVTALPDDAPGQAKLVLRAEGAAPALPAGVPLYLPAKGNKDSAALVGGVALQNGAQINLVPAYIQ